MYYRTALGLDLGLGLGSSYGLHAGSTVNSLTRLPLTARGQSVIIAPSVTTNCVHIMIKSLEQEFIYYSC